MKTSESAEWINYGPKLEVSSLYSTLNKRFDEVGYYKLMVTSIYKQSTIHTFGPIITIWE
jgi:hypothetical protein